MSKKTVGIILALLLVCIITIITPLMTIKDSEFAGADGLAEEAILEINPDYEPWFESIIEPPGGETESLLFCLQTAIGTIILGYGFGYLVARKKYSKASE